MIGLRVKRMAMPFFLALLFVQGCSPAGENDGSAGVEEPAVVPMEHVVFEAQALTLERMFAEGDPEEIIANTESGDAEDYLRDRGVISVSGEEYFVETDIAAWDDEFGSTVEISSGFNDVLRDNEVTWCRDVTSGKEFVEDYIDLYWGSFGTREEYRESFTEYVDCGTGAGA